MLVFFMVKEIREIREIKSKIREVKEIEEEKRKENEKSKPEKRNIISREFVPESFRAEVLPSMTPASRGPRGVALESVESGFSEKPAFRSGEKREEKRFYESVQGIAEDKKKEYLASQTNQDAQTRFFKVGGNGAIRQGPILENPDLMHHRFESPSDESKYYKMDKGIDEGAKKRKLPWEA